MVVPITSYLIGGFHWSPYTTGMSDTEGIVIFNLENTKQISQKDFREKILQKIGDESLPIPALGNDLCTFLIKCRNCVKVPQKC